MIRLTVNGKTNCEYAQAAPYREHVAGLFARSVRRWGADHWQIVEVDAAGVVTVTHDNRAPEAAS